MIQVLYDTLAIPDTCLLGKRVFKKLFHENAKLGITDKKALRAQYWQGQTRAV